MRRVVFPALCALALASCAMGTGSDAGDDTSQVRDGASDAQTDTSQVRDDGPDVREDTWQVPDETSDVPEDTSQVREDASGVPDGTSEVMDGTSGVPDGTSEVPDAAPDVPDATADVPVATGPVLYPTDRSVSPMTEALAARVRAIAMSAPDMRADVFAKVGDSNTVNSNFMGCFAGANVDLAGRTELAPTVAHFLTGDAAGTDPYRRVSQAATIGWSATSAIAGMPSPTEREVTALRPRFATVLFGTNDVEVMNPFSFGENMFTLTDLLIARGVIPVLTSAPPRDDNAAADAWVPRYNAIVRGIAQARGVPFIDLERELRPIMGHGLAGDGVHLQVYVSGGARACAFTTAGLRYGMNVRNLLSITGLHRARLALEGAPAPDATAPTLAGAGTAESPYEITGLPFAHVADTRTAGTRALGRYTGCMATQDESGPEVLYRFVLTARTRVRAMVVSRTGADIDVHLLRASPTEAACTMRNDRSIVADLEAGTWYFSLDTFVSSGSARPGEYLFALVAE